MKNILSFIIAFALSLSTYAQTERWDAMIAQSKAYAQAKSYAEAAKCNEELIAELEANGITDLAVSIRRSNAMYYLMLAEPLLKEKKYAESKAYLDKALADVEPESRAYFLMHRYMGHWYSFQALDIKILRGNLDEAISLSKSAETHYDLAKAPEYSLKEQLQRADLQSMNSNNDEAKARYLHVIEACRADSSRDLLLGRALFSLGVIEQTEEDYESAILHLEEAYTLCLKNPDKTYAKLAANYLHKLYTNSIPEAEKAEIWAKRFEELEYTTTDYNNARD